MIEPQDRQVLQDLARRVGDKAALPIQAERRELWKKHNRLQPVRPMILLFPEGSWEELLTEKDLTCKSDEARCIEWQLRSRIYYHEHFSDDAVIEGEWVLQKAIHNSGWGLEVRRIPSTTARGAWKFDPVIKEPSDLKKLRFPEISTDEEATRQRLAQAHGCVLELVLKDTHTCEHQPERFDRWTQIAREEVDRVSG